MTTTIEVKIVAPELVAAINTLAAALAGKGVAAEPLTAGVSGSTDEGKPEPKPARKPKADAPSADKPSSTYTPPTSEPASEQPSGEAADEQTSASTDAETPAIDYSQVRDLILKIGAKKSRDDVLELLSEFGVAGGKDLKPEQYAEFIEAAEARLAA